MRNNILILIIFSALLSPLVSRAQAVLLKADSVTVPCQNTDTFLVALRVQNFTNVAGLQYTLSWNPAHLDYAYITSIHPTLLGVGFDTTSFLNQGKFTFTWVNPNGTGLSLPNDAVLLKVAFARTGGPATLIQYSNTPTDIVLIDPGGNELQFQTRPGLVSPIDPQGPGIICPGNVTVQVLGPTAVNNIAPQVADNCAVANTGWTAAGSSVYNLPNDPDASGTVFNIGQTTVTYLTTDVGGNTASCSFEVNLELQQTDSLTLIALGGGAPCDQSLKVYVTTLNFDSIAGLQFSLGWDPAVLSYASVGDFNPILQVSNGNFGNAQTAAGFLGFAWTTGNLPYGDMLPNGDTLFSLTFNVVAGGNAATNVQFGDTPTAQLAILGTTLGGEEIGFIAVNGQVNISDTQPPSIQCPANVTVMAPNGSITATVNGLDPLALSDNCSTPNFSYQRSGVTSGQGQGSANGVYNAGTTNVVYTASDSSGNTVTCSFNVTVDAGTPLSFILDTVAIDCQSTGDTIAVNLTVQDFIDIAGAQFDITWDTSVLQFDTVRNDFPGFNLTPGNFFGFNTANNGNVLKFFGGNAAGWPNIPDNGTFFTIYFIVKKVNGTTSLTFTGTIDAANTAFNPVPVVTTNGYFHSADQSPPSITCPPDVTVSAAASECNANVPLDPATATDACSGVKSVDDDQPDNVFEAGVHTVIFTAVDNAGNSAACSMNVTVTDGTPPFFLNCPPDITVDAPPGKCETAVTWQEPTAGDACTPTPPPSVVVSTLSGSVFPTGDSLVTYTATDPFNNTGTCSFTVTVRDSMDPVIACPLDITVSVDAGACTAQVTWTVPDGTDNCDPSVSVTSDSIPGAIFKTGTTPVHYTATDNNGNTTTCSFSVTVVDLNPPVFDICPPDVTVQSSATDCGAFVDWPTITATDDCSNNVTVVGTIPPSNIFPTGTTVVTYVASDAGGNKATCSFIVTVEENVAPVISNCPTGTVINMPASNCDTAVTWIAPTATDNCVLDTLYGTHTPGQVFGTGIHTVTYTAVDSSGNTATCVFIIAVNDLFPPVFTKCPQDTVIDGATPCGVVLNFEFAAIDNCNLDTIIATKQPDEPFYPGTTNVVIQAWDNSNNSDTCAFTVTVNALSTQMFTNFPQDTVIHGCPQTVTWTLPGTTGFCVPPMITAEPDTLEPGDLFPLGITHIIYTAVDTSGVQIQDTLTVTIIDDIPPALNCPESEVAVHVSGVVLSDPDDFITDIQPGEDCDEVELFFSIPTGADNCSVPLIVQTTGQASGLGFQSDSTHVLTFTATDAAGNFAECVVNVSVQGLDALIPVVNPAVACPGSMVHLEVDSIGGAVYEWTGPNGTVPNAQNHFIDVLASNQNAGTYTVVAHIGNCETAPGSAQVAVNYVQAVADTIFVHVDGIPDTFNVVTNDIVLPQGNYLVTVLTQPLPEGLDSLGNGLFAYEPGENYGTVVFLYELCSATCPNLCDTVALVTIQREDTDCSFFPNLITPNGDMENDYFEIPCLDSGFFPRNTLVVYNQWGDKVFEAENYQNDWNGTLNNEPGKDLPDGVYFYVFKSDPNDPPVKGFVQIYR